MRSLWLALSFFSFALNAADTAFVVQTASPTDPSSFRGQVTATKCVIEQYTCPAHPEMATTFEDSYEQANQWSGRCLRRAKEYSIWCANPTGEKTTATFHFADGKKMSSTHVSAGTNCTISQTYCSLYPFLTGSFLDSYEGADNSLHRCARRAEEYSIFCGNPKSEKTVATFRAADGTISSHTYFSKGSSCLISQSNCLRFEGHVGVFADNFLDSAQVASRCLKRAEEYAVWCGNSSGMTTKANFNRADGTTVESTYIVY